MTLRWTAEVHVALRGGIADPEGRRSPPRSARSGTTRSDAVRSGKLLRIDFSAASREEAEAAVAEMCTRLLANPVMEDATWDVAPDQAAGIGVVGR